MDLALATLHPGILDDERAGQGVDADRDDVLGVLRIGSADQA